MLNLPPEMVTCDKCGFTRKRHWKVLGFTPHMDTLYILEKDKGCPRCGK